MSSKAPKAPAKGQRSISSFFATKPRSETAAPKAQEQPAQPHDRQPAAPAGRSSGATQAAPPTHPAPSTADARPTKRARVSEAGSSDRQVIADASSAADAIPARVGTRYYRAQTKLVGSVQQQAGRLSEQQPYTQRQLQPPQGKAKLTPLEEQVVALKKQYPDVLLCIEVGYKMRFFGEDAEVAAKVCHIACYPDHNFLSASIPVPRLPIHVRRLVQAGHKVGIVRQVETAALKAASDTKYKPFERRLTALYTSATLDAGEKADKIGEEGGVENSQEQEALLAEAPANNYLLCLAEGEAAPDAAAASSSGGGAGPSGAAAAEASEPLVGVVAVETSTGDVLYGTCRSGLVQSELEGLLLTLAPCEVVAQAPLTPQTERVLDAYRAATQGCRMEKLPGSGYLEASVVEKVGAFYAKDAQQQQQQQQEEEEEEQEGDAEQLVMGLPALVLRTLAVAIDYLSQFGLESVLRLVHAFRPLAARQEVVLSSNALRQLEILTAGQNGKVTGSLLNLMDRTCTAFGGRLLRRWVSRPLADLRSIEQRLDAVEEMAGEAPAAPLLALPSFLRKLPDVERALARMLHRTACPSEAVTALSALRRVADGLGLPVDYAKGTASVAGVQSSLLVALLRAAAAPEAHAACSELLGALKVKDALENNYEGMFADEARFAEVFERKAALAAAEQHLKDLLPVLAREANVSRLEYVTLQNQGTHMVELPASRTSIPAGWQKVCGTRKVNRFHPPSVTKALATRDIAKEQLQASCSVAWSQFLADFAAHYPVCRVAAQALARLDALNALAALAQSQGYCRPSFVSDDAPPQLHVTGARHPMLDAQLDGRAVPNDVNLSWEGERLAVITGPNMGGKSVYIRMAACIAIMAQVGSFVPAESATMHVFDGIHTRMGASDNLLLGRSTFLEELGDASDILSRATARSLVIMDELGRGTATHDGVAIASATVEHLVTATQSLSLFVTHYPEVADAAQKLPGQVGVFHMAYSLLEEGLPGAAGRAGPAATTSAFTAHTGNGYAGDAASFAVQPSPQVLRLPSQQQQQQQQQDGQPNAWGAPQQAAAATSLSSMGCVHSGAAQATAAADTTAEGEHGSLVRARSAGTGAPAIPKVVFLYKLVQGAADQSFGLNVAQMAGISTAVVQRAAVVAAQLERHTNAHKRRQLEGTAGEVAALLRRLAADTGAFDAAATRDDTTAAGSGKTGAAMAGGAMAGEGGDGEGAAAGTSAAGGVSDGAVATLAALQRRAQQLTCSPWAGDANA